MKINNLENAIVFIYLQPNSFNEELYDTHGIIENKKIYNKTGIIYDIPSDWSYYLTYYTKGPMGGEIKVTSWFDYYEEADIESIQYSWQPTGTYYESPEERARRLKGEQDLIQHIEQEKKEEWERIERDRL